MAKLSCSCQLALPKYRGVADHNNRFKVHSVAIRACSCGFPTESIHPGVNHSHSTLFLLLTVTLYILVIYIYRFAIIARHLVPPWWSSISNGHHATVILQLISCISPTPAEFYGIIIFGGGGLVGRKVSLAPHFNKSLVRSHTAEGAILSH